MGQKPASEYGTVSQKPKKDEKMEIASEYGTDAVMPVAKPKDDLSVFDKSRTKT